MTPPTAGPVSLESTTLATATYHDALATLQLDFCDGTHYVYFGIPPNLYRGLLRAASKGSFFNRYIRDRFPYAQLSAEN